METIKKTSVKKSKEKKDPAISPLAPERFPDIPALEGVHLGVARTGVKYKGRSDLLVARFDKGAQGAGVFTQSQVVGAPIDWCRSVVDSNHGAAGPRVLVVNAGNANVFTGQAGKEAVRATAAAAATMADCRQKDVLIASTGVIGEILPVDKVVGGIEKIGASDRAASWEKAAQAILTTDTFAKGAFAEAEIDGEKVRLCGIAKGSGMIAPDMATMLAFIFTDAAIPAPILQTLLSVNVRHTFNAITVDSDTSTSDAVMLFATGKVSHRPITRAGDRRLQGFRAALSDVMSDLAQQVVRDGEGASKFITVSVKGASNAKSARAIALSIGNSPLVKTAIAGEDANWGRVVMAVGKSGESVDIKKLCVRMGGYVIAKAGGLAPEYEEKPVAKHLKGQDILIEVDVGVGKGEATIWTCDLTHGYISINADYRS